MKQILLATMMTAVVAFQVEAQTRKTVPPAQQQQPRKMVTPTYQSPATITSSGSSWGAAGFQNELDLNLSEGYLKTYKIGSKSYTDFNLGGAYSYDLGQNIQVGADIGLRSFDSTTRLTLVGTGTYNLDANYSDSVFFKGGLGLYPVDKVSSTGTIENKNEFGLYLAAGKRFKLWDHVNYKPMIAIAKISDLDAQITIQFLNVSVNWN